jgi:hypothetical protein
MSTWHVPKKRQLTKNCATRIPHPNLLKRTTATKTEFNLPLVGGVALPISPKR